MTLRPTATRASVLAVAYLALVAALLACIPAAQALPQCAVDPMDILECDPNCGNGNGGFCSLGTSGAELGIAGDHCTAQCIISFPADPCMIASWAFHRDGMPLRDKAGVGALSYNPVRFRGESGGRGGR